MILIWDRNFHSFPSRAWLVQSNSNQPCTVRTCIRENCPSGYASLECLRFASCSRSLFRTNLAFGYISMPRTRDQHFESTGTSMKTRVLLSWSERIIDLPDLFGMSAPFREVQDFLRGRTSLRSYGVYPPLPTPQRRRCYRVKPNEQQHNAIEKRGAVFKRPDGWRVSEIMIVDRECGEVDTNKRKIGSRNRGLGRAVIFKKLKRKTSRGTSVP